MNAYRAIARNLPDTTLLMFDMQMRYVIAEGRDLPILGFSTGKVLGHTPEQALPRAEAQIFIPIYQAALEGEESRLERRYGTSIYEIHVIPVRDDGDLIEGGLVVCRNITASRQVQERYRDSERRVRALLDGLPDVVMVVDRNGTIVELSAPQNWSTDLDVGAWMPGLSLRDLGFQETGLRTLLDLLDSAFSATGVLRAVIDLDLTHGYEARLLALSDRHVMMMLRDVSELRAAQAALQVRVEQLTALRAIEAQIADRLDMQHVVAMGFQAAVELTGADAGTIALVNEQHRLKVVQATYGLRNEDLQDLILHGTGITERVFQTGSAVFVPDVGKDPDYYALNPETVAQITVPLVARERVVGLITLESFKPGQFKPELFEVAQLLASRIATAIENATLYDQVRRHLDSLTELHARVSALEQAKTDMLNLGAHDLRNPLMLIFNYAAMAEEEARQLPEPEVALNALNEVRIAAERMQSIAVDILDANRIESMVVDAQLMPIDLAEVLASAAETQVTDANRKDIDYTIQPIKGVWMGRGDAPLIREAAINMIANAIKYTPRGGQVQVALTSRKGVLEFSVTDSGPGIPDTLHHTLFKPMRRTHSRETRNEEGTGLGLYLVRRIMERHGGEVFFTSVYKQGSTFGFRLPLDE